MELGKPIEIRVAEVDQKINKEVKDERDKNIHINVGYHGVRNGVINLVYTIVGDNIYHQIKHNTKNNL